MILRANFSTYRGEKGSVDIFFVWVLYVFIYSLRDFQVERIDEY